MASRMLAAVGSVARADAVDEHALDDVGVVGCEPFLRCLDECARIGAGEPKIAIAQPWILVDADGDDVERPALIEVSVALVGNGDGLCLFSDGIGQGDTHLVAAFGQTARRGAARPAGTRPSRSPASAP